MAETLVYRIQFTADNPYGTFVSGDIVDIYYDPDADPVPANGSSVGYSVKKNNVTVTSGNVILMPAQSYTIESNQFAQICNDTTLILTVRGTIEFPYVIKTIEPDHPACAIDPGTCDLIIIGIPTTISASGPTESDGVLNVVATSENPIQYKLGAPFIYGDGTAQSSGTFSGLVPGTYRVYVRNSLNCSTDVQVIVGFSNTYSTIYRLEYVDIGGGPTRIDVKKRDYSGPITEVCGAGIPFERSLRGEGSLNKFEPILSTEAQLNLTSIADFEFGQLYTNSPEDFLIEYYKDLGNYSDPSSGEDPIILPGLSSWNTTSLNLDNPEWNTGINPFVDLVGAGFDADVSEILYADYAFMDGSEYTVTVNYTKTHISGGQNPRVFFLRVYDGSFNIQFEASKAITPGTVTETITISFVANADSTRLGVVVNMGTVCRVQINEVSGVVKVDVTPEPLGLELLGTYKVLPQQYAEDYKAPPYYVSVIATDGLPSLKDYPFLQDDGQRFNGIVKQIQLIALILRKTRLALNIRCACNLFAVDMEDNSEVLSNDPLDQAFVDVDAYYLATDEPTFDYVLRAILKPYGARTVQENSKWNIVRVEEMRSEYAYREFDPNGVYLSNGTFNPIVDRNINGITWSDRNHNMELRPGFGKIIAQYNLGLRENILKNGDFRLKSVFNPTDGTFSYAIDLYGFQLVNTGYPVFEGFERVDQEGNIAYTIYGGSSDDVSNPAYIQTDVYTIKMGINDSLRIRLRFKLSVVPGDPLYQKIRLQVRYGIYYLKSNGLWSTDPNELVFFVEEFGKYTEAEIIAFSPDVGAADGYEFTMRMYQSFVNDADYTDFNSLIAVPTEEAMIGTKTQVRSGALKPVRLYYYELEESEEPAHENVTAISSRGSHDPSGGSFPSSGGSGGGGVIQKGDTWALSANGVLDGQNVFEGARITAKFDTPASNFDEWWYNLVPEIVVPADYLFDIHPYQWVLKGIGPGLALGGNRGTNLIAIDEIAVEFLVNGNSPVDTVIREIKGEVRNNEVATEELIHGSYSTVISTASIYELGIDSFSRFANTISSIITTSVLSADILYTGYLRDADGNGFENWVRPGIAESDKLHGIFLKMYAAQYKRSWRKITGSLYGNNGHYFNFLNVLREVSDSNRLYLPISLRIDDKNNRYSGEFLELMDITADGGSDGSGESPFNSAFSTGFGASGFN
jgi:hypothetical protein